MNTLYTRIIHSHDTEANWNKLPELVLRAGELIVYDVDSTHTSVRFKIGDGKTPLQQLPFQHEDIMKNIIQDPTDNVIFIDAGRI